MCNKTVFISFLNKNGFFGIGHSMTKRIVFSSIHSAFNLDGMNEWKINLDEIYTSMNFELV